MKPVIHPETSHSLAPSPQDHFFLALTICSQNNLLSPSPSPPSVSTSQELTNLFIIGLNLSANPAASSPNSFSISTFSPSLTQSSLSPRSVTLGIPHTTMPSNSKKCCISPIINTVAVTSS